MTLLQLRKERKRHKPYFVVKESLYRGGRVKRRWRANRGIHSGVRQYHKGKPAMPTTGYGSPREVRGLHPSGARSVLVHTAKELLSLQKGEGAIIAATVGTRARLKLFNLALEKKIPLLNVREPATAVEKIKAGLAQRAVSRQEWQKNKNLKLEERQKKAEEKKKKEEKERKEEKKRGGGERGEEKKGIETELEKGLEKEAGKAREVQAKEAEEEKLMTEKTLIKPQ